MGIDAEWHIRVLSVDGRKTFFSEPTLCPHVVDVLSDLKLRRLGWKQHHCITLFNVWLGCNALLLPRGQDGLRLIPYPLPTIVCWSCEDKRWSFSCAYSGAIGRLSGSLWRSSFFHSHNWAKLWILSALIMMTTWQDTRGWELRSDANY